MSDAGAHPRPNDAFSRFVDMPRLELPKFALRSPNLRPPSPMPEPQPLPPVPVAIRVPETHDSIPAPSVVPSAPAPVMRPAPYPRAAAQVSAVDPSRLERLRSDAMLGLVVGIGIAVIAVATVVMLWSKFHGVAPGTF